MKQSGHKFQRVEDSAALEQALKTGTYDLLLVDRADADGAQQQVQSTPSRPMVLPIVYKSTKFEASQVEKRFHCVLKAPGNFSQYLSAIDHAMEFRIKASQGNVSRR